MELVDDTGCTNCGDDGRTVEIEVGLAEVDSIWLCEKCLTEAMLLIRPFSVNPPPFVVR